MNDNLNLRGQDNDDPPSWGGVVVGLLLGIGGAFLLYYRYNQFQHINNAAAEITKVEMLIYKVAGKRDIVLLVIYAIVALSGFYLAISNFIRLIKLRSKRDT
ncbi:hypothetical protein DVR12_07480 [Chitinophaga silvatica]|uniref:Uncharacterized protein n=1 Tax=Chitinophaga silvatica TaxID=2282649 RepID=A0A3E1YER7_9BACT|nr:hypothetical protein [Chitinophaga silvatica]RFS25018.1 hypothetical protein DVR12_07480 [Chitinophaga silvatica]